MGLRLGDKRDGCPQALPDDKNALGQLPSPLPERVAVVVSVERAMLCRKEREMVSTELGTLMLSHRPREASFL